MSTYGTGIVNQPAGIAINSKGVIAISEHGGSNRLWVYDRDQTKLLGMTQGAFFPMALGCRDGILQKIMYTRR